MTDNRPILEAITLRRCIAATYNRTRMTLAPHVLYTRHGDLFVDAIAVERDGRELTDLKLGTYKLAGLTLVEVVDRSFEPLAGFNRDDPRYDETTPFSI